MIEKIWKFHGGVHPEQKKDLSNQSPIQKAGIPEKLILPLQQHIGEINKPIVKLGDKVLKGQMIAHTNAYISAPIHAPTSGTIIAIEEMAIAHPSGLTAPCIVLQPDFEDKWMDLPATEDFYTLSKDEIRQRIRNAGIVGLGGATFPTSVKVNVGNERCPVHTIILNGAECEPYITCDDKFMQEHAEDILKGLEILKYLVTPAHCIIGLEDNKPEAYQSLIKAKEKFCPDLKVDIVSIPTVYPTGGEKQLIKILTNKEVPSGRHACEIGIIGLNVASVAAIYYAIQLNKPLISRIVTVTGENIKNPGNFETLIGTPFKYLIEKAGGYKENIDNNIIMGGPMMGFTVANDEVPIVKGTNCILVKKQEKPKLAMPCIRCAACVEVCPANLLPQQLYWYSKAKDVEKAKEYNLFDCIECGCCAYVCPSNIPLVQYYRAAKTDIAYQEREKQKADIAKLRHDYREARLAEEKRLKEERLKAKRAAVQQNTEDDKQAAIQAALERVKAKKAKEQ